jgi:hypothetical protein
VAIVQRRDRASQGGRPVGTLAYGVRHGPVTGRLPSASPARRPAVRDRPLSRFSEPSISVADLMRSFDLDHIDVLKLDIEGSEKEVFEDSAEWIDRVSAIAIELHDRFKSGCSRAFYAATTGFAHEVTRDEDTFVRRELQSRQITMDTHNVGDGPATSRVHGPGRPPFTPRIEANAPMPSNLRDGAEPTDAPGHRGQEKGS